MHFNSRLGLDGLGTFADDKFTPVDLGPTDVLVVTAKAMPLPENKEVDQFTIDLERTPAGADMVLRWPSQRPLINRARCRRQLAKRVARVWCGTRTSAVAGRLPE